MPAVRQSTQRGVFTLHGKKGLPIEFLAAEDQCDLVEFVVPQASIVPIRIELLLGGVEETTIFPDLEGLARELNFRWTIDSVPEWRRDKQPYKRFAKWDVTPGESSDSRIVPEAR